jgi:hypothetical protein
MKKQNSGYISNDSYICECTFNYYFCIVVYSYDFNFCLRLDPKNKFTMCTQTHDKNKMVDHH